VRGLRLTPRRRNRNPRRKVEADFDLLVRSQRVRPPEPYPQVGQEVAPHMTSRIAAALMTALELTDIRAIDKACIVGLRTQFEFGPVGFQRLCATPLPGFLFRPRRVFWGPPLKKKRG